jgi:hypothetical protein
LKPTGKLGTINRLERLFAIDEPEVYTMFVRDADSRVHWKDRWAINDFLSKPQFIGHVIRDNKQHGVKIPAGLLGLHKIDIHVRSLYEEFLKNPKELYFGDDGIDQSFLGSYLYPIITSKTLIHYSYKFLLLQGENGVEFPFVYDDSCFCGKPDGPQFVDISKLRFVNGRFKL